MAEEFDDSRIWDRGGLRLRGGGRVTPGGGRLSNIPPEAADAAATLLADFDFSAPVESYDFSSANATDEWLLQETSGTHANNVGSATLSNTGGLQGQDAVGLWDGSSYIARNAWEGLDNGDYLVCSDTTVGDPGGSDFCVRVVLRTNDTVNNAYVVSKWDSGPKGWWIRLNSSGNPRFEVDDGTNPPVTVASAASVTDGAWHHITAWWDESTNTAYIKTDLLAEASTTGSATAATTTTAIHVNQRSGLAGGGSHMQVAYLGVCVGANAEAMYDETTTLPGSDPTGLLTTISRASLISTEVAAGYVCHFGQGVTNDQMPIGYNANFADTNKLGLYCNSAVTNMLPDSELLSNLNTSNVTVSDNQADSPDGLRSASSITANANLAYAYKTNISVSSSTEYNFSVWVKRNGGSDVAGMIRIYDIANAGYVLEQAFTATDTWQRVSGSGTIGAAATTAQFHIRVDTNTESIFAWGAQAELGDGATAYIRTSGASASLVVSDYIATASAGTLVTTIQGESETIWVPAAPTAQSVNPYLYHVQGSGNANRHYLRSGDSDTTMRLYLWDGAAVYEDDLTQAAADRSTQENVTVCTWDSSLDTDSMKLETTGETTVTSSTGPWTAANTITDVDIGSIGGGNQPDAFIQRIRFWNGEVV